MMVADATSEKGDIASSGVGLDQTFFQNRQTFFLSFARFQPNFRETFAKVACLKVELRAVFLGVRRSRLKKFPNYNMYLRPRKGPALSVPCASLSGRPRPFTTPHAL